MLVIAMIDRIVNLAKKFISCVVVFSSCASPQMQPKVEIGKVNSYPVVSAGMDTDMIHQFSYTDNGDGTITDHITGLIWQKNIGDKMTYEQALEKLKQLNTGKYSDWRIPTIKELFSLANYRGRVFGDQVIDPFIDTSFFDQPVGDKAHGEREIDAQVWSATDHQGTTMHNDQSRFGFNFWDGRLKAYPITNPLTHKANQLYFRFVRGNSDYGHNYFIDNADSTVTDLATGLMWQKYDSQRGMDWFSAKVYADSLQCAGYADWRLPTIKELQSIVDYTVNVEKEKRAAIDSIFHVSSTRDPEGNFGFPFFWSSTPLHDGPHLDDYAAYICFGLASGKMHDKLVNAHGSGAVRSDPKSINGQVFPRYFGPQGDVQYVYNFVRCVREK
jgi:hypothetical protein